MPACHAGDVGSIPITRSKFIRGNYYVGSNKCTFSGCANDPIAKFNWGTDSLGLQKAKLCQQHADELWETLNPLLQTNDAWFYIEPLDKES